MATMVQREWFYVSAGAQAGPISQTQFAELVASGAVKSQTMVWTAGLAGWTAYGSLPADMSVWEDARLVNCDCCGRLLSSEDVIELGLTRICADCKPAYLQRLKEGLPLRVAAPTDTSRYGGFWIRAGAKVIDLMVLGVFSAILTSALRLVLFGRRGIQSLDPEDFILFMVVTLGLSLLQICVAASYTTWMIGRFGATVGKLACDLRVVTPEGKPSYWRAFGRYWAEMISQAALFVGYLLVIFDAERRSLHDRICNTWVVKV
jgi:uncharacterized RDD family membrane protein YckC